MILYVRLVLAFLYPRDLIQSCGIEESIRSLLYLVWSLFVPLKKVF